MSARPVSQPPLFAVTCPVCAFRVAGEHEPWCPQFLRGAEPGGDPSEWPSLFDGHEGERV